MSALPTCMYVCHMCAWHLQKSEVATDVTELELGMPSSYHVGAGGHTQVFCKISKVLLTAEQSL